MNLLILLMSILVNISGIPAACSGTLPLVYINTLSGQDITSKDEYVHATLYIDPINTGYDSLASAFAPDTVEIRGRGNWTWNGFDKKPYKIKLSEKSEILGMQKSKHWALMAAADDNLGFLKNPVGYYLSRMIGLRWTPSCVPVELMLNGRYQGLYFITETVRLESKRAHGDWLVEIDNYSSAGQVYLQEGNGQYLMITPSDPDSLSVEQFNWLSTQMNDINTTLYADASMSQASTSTWTDHIDLTECVRYYLVNEIMCDCESYHGSCYLHYDGIMSNRDQTNSDSIWYFGPVWDFGNSLNRIVYGGHNDFIYNRPEFEQYWIGQIAQHREFQEKLSEEWYIFYHTIYPTLDQAVDSIVSTYSGALSKDALRWKNSNNVNTYSSKSAAKDRFLDALNNHISWLHSQWGEGTKPETSLNHDTSAGGTTKILKNGKIYILRNGIAYDLNGIVSIHE